MRLKACEAVVELPRARSARRCSWSGWCTWPSKPRAAATWRSGASTSTCCRSTSAICAGILTEEDALDLLCHLWARLDEIGEVQNICIGGLTPGGEDATNQLSYLCLEATRRVQSPHTNLSARFHDGTPDAFHRACFEVIRTGIGFPAIFNDHVLLPGWRRSASQPRWRATTAWLAASRPCCPGGSRPGPTAALTPPCTC
jgi:hypothetical protein